MKENPQQRYIHGETWGREAPRPAAVAHEILSHSLNPSVEDKTESHEALNDMYKALADHDSRLIAALDKLEQKNQITNQDVLALSVLLAVSKTLGPDLNFLYQAVVTGVSRERNMDEMIAALNVDQRIIDYLKRIVPQLKTQ